MADKITWANIRVTLDELDPWPRNPRQIKGDQAKRLAQSYDDFGEVEPVAIGPKNERGKYPLYNGHQRYFVLQKEHGGKFEVNARVSSRPLTEKEREKLTVFLHRGATGSWDFDTLANEFDFGELLEWGFEERDLIGRTTDIPFDAFDGEGDGGGSRLQTGDKVRIVIGSLMFDIPDVNHDIYRRTAAADADVVRERMESLLAGDELI